MVAKVTLLGVGPGDPDVFLRKHPCLPKIALKLGHLSPCCDDGHNCRNSAENTPDNGP